MKKLTSGSSVNGARSESDGQYRTSKPNKSLKDSKVKADVSMTVASGPNPSPPPTGPALRRLHYKATHRSHLHHNTTATALPKVIVMGTSTTSDITNNTSTESQATAVTSITVTDDSLDTEPSESNHQIPNLIDSPPPKVPSTAPPGYHREGDFFNSLDYDSPAYTKPQSATDKLDSPRPGPARFIFDVQLPRPIEETKTTANGIQNGSEKLMNAKIDRREKRRESQPALHNASIALRRQFDGVDIFSPGRRKSFQHCVPVSSPRRQSNAAQVHVTANPLDSAATTVVTGRTTIVVQQPSLSLDFGGYTTILLRDGDKSSGRRMSRCHDNLQQLLDVTSQFTHEDLQDFDKRYGSPHHSRSQSVKAVRKTDRHLLGLPQQRARVASMPNTGVEEEYYRLRHFSITGKGIVNRGDSLRSRRSRSNTSVASSASSNEHLSRTSAPCSLASSRDSSAGISSYRVLVLGSTSVGKSSLIGQFMTSEYLHAYDTSIDDESGERSVCVLLAGEESEITFLDSPSENVIRDGSAHGYCIVYSTSDRDSFEAAEKTLRIVWGSGHTHTKAVILVGNKADLERSRTVPTEEGKNLATSYDSKFIETSVGINHNVDELLVGLLTQIRLKQQQSDKARKRATRKPRTRNRSPHEIEPINTQIQLFNGNSSATNSPTKRGRLSGSVKVRGLLGKVWPRDSKSKSCENLHVL